MARKMEKWFAPIIYPMNHFFQWADEFSNHTIKYNFILNFHIHCEGNSYLHPQIRYQVRGGYSALLNLSTISSLPITSVGMALEQVCSKQMKQMDEHFNPEKSTKNLMTELFSE